MRARPLPSDPSWKGGELLRRGRAGSARFAFRNEFELFRDVGLDAKPFVYQRTRDDGLRLGPEEQTGILVISG
jgi:hypothetical protein